MLVTGRTGSGKSSFLEWFIRNEGDYSKVFIFDAEGEFAQRLKCKPVYNLTELNKETGKFVCFDPQHFNGPIQEAFEEFCLYLFCYAQAANEKVLGLIDELQTYVNAYSLPEPFMDCLLRGRRYRLDLLLASQQANFIHNAVRSSLSDVVSFGQADTNAVKFVERIGIEGVMELEDLHFIWKTIGSDKIKNGKIHFDGSNIKTSIRESRTKRDDTETGNKSGAVGS
jgi:hypothetical protein